MNGAKVVCEAYKKARRLDANFGDQSTEDFLCIVVAGSLGSKDEVTEEYLKYVTTQDFAQAFWKKGPQGWQFYYNNLMATHNKVRYIGRFVP